MPYLSVLETSQHQQKGSESRIVSDPKAALHPGPPDRLSERWDVLSAQNFEAC